MSLELDRRRALLAAALGFLQLPPPSPELRLLHSWLDTWTGLGLVTAGVERQGLGCSLSSHHQGRVAGDVQDAVSCAFDNSRVCEQSQWLASKARGDL